MIRRQAIGARLPSLPAGGRRPPREVRLARVRPRRRLPVGAALAALLAALLASAAGAPAQEPEREAAGAPDGPVSADSADRLRAALVQPPGEPPTDALDLLSVPLKAAAVPAELAAYAVKGLLWWRFRPGPPNLVVAALRNAQREGLRTELSGFGPRGGLGVGLSFERFEPFFVETGISVRGSQRHVVGFESPVGGDRWGVRAEASYRRYAEPHFWGIGAESDEASEADYRWDRWGVEGAAGVATGPVVWEVGVGWEENRVARGSDHSTPDLIDVVDPDSLFGLRRATRYLRPGAGLTLDLTHRRGFQPRGFRASLEGTAFLGVGGSDSEFLRWNAELVGYLPLNPRQQLAVRGVAELNRPLAGGEIPFTHLASLGGSSSLRARDSQRYRDRDLLALISEWRYEVWREKRGAARAEGLVFLDAGTVARRLDRLDASTLKADYGFGMRVMAGDGLALLWYLGFGGGESEFRVKTSWPF